MSADQPWNRTTRIPVDGVTAHDLSQLPEHEIAQMIRSNLLPAGADDRDAWAHFWGTLRQHQPLSDRAQRILEHFIEHTNQAAAEPGRSKRETERINHFHTRCQERLRIFNGPTKTQQTALAWAGDAGKFGPSAARVINDLVQAIHTHRSDIEDPNDADTQLWDILRKVNLDPNDHTSKAH